MVDAGYDGKIVDKVKNTLIECICYHETHDLFEPLIQEGNRYRIYNPEIKLANKLHTQVENDFRLIMQEGVTTIEPFA